ncbi:MULTISPECIES: Ppx/GppA phosphatase family protein [unclassified Bosea (in: a-proteobacteria)]|uniref:Ppx/GppA phosphatase family protein n=1 Tax=unclassified Bosea (in: a-proteobacteria) TaxID=2653178 RepID=UPI0009552FFB|nr:MULTISPECIES: Ppx/GppA phosphatase family protein [unclassified Bosea (in: a-proteobacteria)]TAJ28243.1 MAG: Ppx/GppA family phosphatase [Bosea sp. (in: a-proteobacteria)]SIR07057.1 exopolyphosphatase / guanosine-5'-triphosphate,3'-diphosphate pyrophosphatase [Bosea sp. TND4EK4]
MAVEDRQQAGAAHAAPPKSSVDPWRAGAAAAVAAHRQHGAPQSARPHGATYAALDLGTNNCRLLIARPAQHGFRVVDAFSRIVRLGEGLGASSKLGDAAMDRAVDALKVCRSKMANRGVTRARLVTTEACRAATNGLEFVRRVSAEAGLALEIIDQRTEASLAVSGCAALVDPKAESAIVFDIGGGSTEIIWLGGRNEARDPAARIREWASLPIGVVTVAERYGGVDVGRELFERMVADCAQALEPFAAKAARASGAAGFHLLGTSGTVTTVAGIHLGLPRYDRREVDGLWMQQDDVLSVIDRLIEMDYAARAANACIGRDRADLVLAGCAIFEAIRRAFPSERVRIADRGLREGILLRMMHEDRAWWRRR